MDDWDPTQILTSGKDADFITKATKRAICNILKSYTGWYDAFSELIQNALDAVEERYTQLGGNFRPQMWIHVDLRNNQVSVTDNGTGFEEDKFRCFLAPNVGFKDGTKARGKKGVGATYLAYGYNLLQIGTKTPDFTYVGTIRNGRKWAEDDPGQQDPPHVRKEDPLHEAFDSLDQGSTFTVRFGGNNTLPKDLKWIGADTPDQWDAVLRAKTPLGGVYLDCSITPTVCHLKVTDNSGISRMKDIDRCEYTYPHMLFQSCSSVSEIQEAQEGLRAKKKDPSKLPAKYQRLNGIYHTWTTDELLGPNSPIATGLDDYRPLLTAYRPIVYGFFCYSTELWGKYSQDTVGLRKGERVLDGGIRLASSTMIQGPDLMIPLKRYIGYQNTTHVVIHFSNAEPDLGRKGFQPELVDLGRQLGIGVVNTLRTWKHVLKQDTGSPPQTDADTQLHDWIVRQEQHETNYPLVIKGKGLYMPTEELAILSEPTSEQDVVVLFSQMLTSGIIRGIRTLATSEHQRYDGLYRVLVEPPLERFEYHRESNPLGIQKESLKATKSRPYVLEYKYSLDALIRDFENEDKSERDIELVVAWEMGTRWKERYQVTSLLDRDNLQHRYFHGFTHIISNAMTGAKVFNAIILKDLVSYLSNTEQEEKSQRRIYAPD